MAAATQDGRDSEGSITRCRPPVPARAASSTARQDGNAYVERLQGASGTLRALRASVRAASADAMLNKGGDIPEVLRLVTAALVVTSGELDVAVRHADHGGDGAVRRDLAQP